MCVCVCFLFSIAVRDINAAPADYTLVTTAVTFAPSDASKSKPIILIITDDEMGQLRNCKASW